MKQNLPHGFTIYNFILIDYCHQLVFHIFVELPAAKGGEKHQNQRNGNATYDENKFERAENLVGSDSSPSEKSSVTQDRKYFFVNPCSKFCFMDS